MKFGVQMVFQSWGYDERVDDAQLVAEEIRLGELADQLGFDALWPVEHHFEDYALCPTTSPSSPIWPPERSASASRRAP